MAQQSLSTHQDSREIAKGRAVRGAIMSAVAAVTVAAGVACAAALLAPDTTEQVFGDAQQAIGQWRIDATKETPKVRLGPPGGSDDLSTCTGQFFEMASYAEGSVKIPPVFAAHNDCGGDVILPLRVSDLVDVAAADGTISAYRVVEIRETPKVWVTTERLEGLAGAIVLQTCHFGGSDVPMKFVALEPVTKTG